MKSLLNNISSVIACVRFVLVFFCSVMAVPATVIYFTCYEQLCAALRVRMGSHTEEAPLLAGAIARGELTSGL